MIYANYLESDCAFLFHSFFLAQEGTDEKAEAGEES